MYILYRNLRYSLNMFYLYYILSYSQNYENFMYLKIMQMSYIFTCLAETAYRTVKIKEAKKKLGHTILQTSSLLNFYRKIFYIHQYLSLCFTA